MASRSRDPCQPLSGWGVGGSLAVREASDGLDEGLSLQRQQRGPAAGTWPPVRACRRAAWGAGAIWGGAVALGLLSRNRLMLGLTAGSIALGGAIGLTGIVSAAALAAATLAGAGGATRPQRTRPTTQPPARK